MRQADLHWLAGLLEGEGCFYVHKQTRYSYPAIQIQMCDLDVVQRAVDIMGGNSVCTFPPRGRRKQTVYRVRVSGSRASALMTKLHPHMGARRKDRIAGILRHHGEP